MIRTLISLDDEDKTWLDRKAKEEGITMAQVVRSAVKRYREQCEASETEPSLEQLLRRTAGSWREGDGLAYQRAVRGEWERSPEDEGSGS
jgi:hypothetical protein